MAFNFIKKVFSFGSKKVEEVGDPNAPVETPQPAPVEVPAEPTPAETPVQPEPQPATPPYEVPPSEPPRPEPEPAPPEVPSQPEPPQPDPAEREAAERAAREAEELARLNAEAERIEAEWLEARRLAAEEEEREAARRAEEEAAREVARQAELAARRKEEEERERAAAAERIAAEEAQARKAAEIEAEAARRAEEEAAQQAELEARRLAEAQRERAEAAEREAAHRAAEASREAERAAEAERLARERADADAAEIAPPIREPGPAPVNPVIAEIAPEPSPSKPPPETPTPPIEAEPKVQQETSVEAAPPPVAEVLPPIREPDPLPPVNIRDEIAPELEPLTEPPPAPKPAAGKVTVAKTVEKKAEPVAPAAPAPKQSWFQRMREGLSRSSRELSANITGIFTKRKLDEDTLQDLEDVLIRADLGVETAMRVTDTLAATRMGRDIGDAEVRGVMATEIEKVLKPVALPLELDLSHKPHVILVVGVNGTGKTTTIGKLAAKLHQGGLSVTLAAGDTFRAAAIEQLKIWGERTGSPVVSSKLGADAAGLAYDAFEKAKEAGSDVLIIDTAGRLQNRTELMAELEKIVRVLGKLDPDAPHTVLQTVDATTGQNALNQVEIFRNVAGVNGLVMTKLDGTARGGILVAIAAKHKLPVYFIGVGEQVDDLEPFSANEFARAIAGVA